MGFKKRCMMIIRILAMQSVLSLFLTCSTDNPDLPGISTSPPLVQFIAGDSACAVNDSIRFTVSAYDSNGGIKAYLWSIDGITFNTAYAPTFKAIWPPWNFGLKKLYVKVIDDAGLVSAVDSTMIMVHQYAPLVIAMNNAGPMRDTTVSCRDSLFVNIAAGDSNGAIVKYFLDIGADGWDDSTSNLTPVRYVKYPAGGYVPIVVGAEDDDGIMGADTFHALFNRPPVSCGLKIDYNAEKNGWSDYNYSTGIGSIQVSFLGHDPDSVHDSLKYVLFWGADPNNLLLKYSGNDTLISIPNIPSQTLLYWKVVAKDLFGDSVAQTGIHSLAAIPPVGLFWNLDTNNIITPFAINRPTPFNDRLWQFVKNKTDSKGYDADNKPLFDYYYSVYNSPDCKTWNLVKSGLIVPFAIPQPTAFAGKMWVFINNKTVPKGVDALNQPLLTYYHSVYNSIDGVTWNNVADSVELPFAMPQPTAFDGKMWIFINTASMQKNNGENGGPAVDYQHSVYNSIDCITWNLAANSALLPFVMPQPVAFDGKMWIYVNNKTVFKGNDPEGRQLFDYYHSIYISADCLSWNLMTNTMVLPFAMPEPVSFGGTMRVFINTNGVPKGTDSYGKPLFDYYHSIYKSGN